MVLPTNIDTTYDDDAGDSTVALHQQHHDEIHAKLNGIEPNATADQTAAEILTAIKTVDGSGSGLDADLLDGNNASAFQAAHANLTALAGLALIADRLPYANGTGTLSLATLTAAGRALLDDASASDQLTTLGVSTFIKDLLDDADAATARATLGVTPGVTDHGALSGLADDDHPQYAKKADAEAGSTLLYERTASLTTTSTTYAATHQARVGIGGTYTVEFTLSAAAGGGGRVYRNGVAVGTERLAPGTYSEDIAGWEAGDLVQIYVKTNNGAIPAGASNFRIKASALPFYPQQVA